MIDQNTFTETIREVAEIIRTAPEPMTREEILSYFTDMELSEEQTNMVLEFLLTPHEDEIPEDELKTDDIENETDSREGMVTLADELDTEIDLDAVFPEGEQPVPEKKDIIPNTRVFQMYLEELEGTPVYSKDDFDEMYPKLLHGSQEVIATITAGWMRRVLEIAKNLADSPEGFEDVVQEGNMALFLKLTELCGSGAKVDVDKELENAVMDSMKQCISEFAGEDDDENAIVGKVNLVNEAKKYLADTNGYEPTAAELADYTKLPVDELEDILIIIQKAAKKK